MGYARGGGQSLYACLGGWKVRGQHHKSRVWKNRYRDQEKASMMGPRSGNSSDLQPPLVSAGDGMHLTVLKRVFFGE